MTTIDDTKNGLDEKLNYLKLSYIVRGNLKMYFIGRFETVLLIVCIYFPKLYFLLLD